MTHDNKVLIIDDDENLLNGIRRYFGKRFNLAVAKGGEDALKLVERDGPFAAVLCDMRMPGMDGVEVLETIRKKAPFTVRMMLTGNADQKTASDAINRAKVYRFFNKPCSPSDLAAGIEEAVELHRRVAAEREMMETTLAGSVRMMMDILALVDPASFARAAKLRQWMTLVADRLQTEDAWQMEMAAGLSLIGLVSVPPEVLSRKRKGEPLSPTEEDMFRHVPEVGRNLLLNIPKLEDMAEIVYYQDKDFSGKGFPDDDLAGQAIPLGARILRLLKALADSDEAIPTTAALDQLERHGQRFDPLVLAAAKQAFSAPAQTRDGALESILDVPVTALRVGDVLLANLELADGHLILAAGLRLSDALIPRIRNLQKIHAFAEPIKVRRARPSA